MKDEALQIAEKQAAEMASASEGFFKQCLQVTALDTADHAQWAMTTAHSANELKKQAELERKGITQPINDALRQINAKYKPFTQMCDRVIAHLKSLTVAYQTREQEAAQARLAVAATAQSHEEIAQSVASIATPVAGISMRKNWTWEIVDASQIPREYYVLDTARLDREAKRLEDGMSVPGIRPINKPTAALSR